MKKSQNLIAHLRKYVTLDENEAMKIAPCFKYTALKKKEMVLRSGERCTSAYFVLSGCLHMYFINRKGIEQTIQFGIENWWITDFLAFYNQGTTEFYIRAVEGSEVLILEYTDQQELFERVIQLEKYFRIIYQIAYGASMMRLKYLFDYSKEEIYFRFRAQFPEFVERVPQYLLATFLGLTPE